VGFFDPTPENLSEITERVSRQSPLEMRGWQLLDPDPEHMVRVIDAAAEYRINHIQLSHGIVHSVCTLENESWRIDRINLAARHAHRHGMEVVVWTHELDGIPHEFIKDGRVDLRRADLWRFLARRYENLFKAAPDLDGLVLTFQETAASVYHDEKVISDDPHDVRVQMLIDTLHQACRKHNKKLIVRNFCYTGAEMEAIKRALLACDDSIVIMPKCQPHDWNPYYPHDPTIAEMGARKRLMVEYDLGEEFHGQNQVPYVCPQYIRYRLNHAIHGGVSGAVARIERFDAHALGTVKELDLAVYSAILNDPQTNVQALVDDWAQQRFGKSAAADAMAALTSTFQIVNSVVYLHGLWGLLLHSMVADYLYVLDSLLNWTQVGDWTGQESHKRLQQRVIEGDDEFVEHWDAHLDRAQEMLSRSLKQIGGSDHTETRDAMGMLRDDFARLEAFVKVNAAHHRAFSRLRRWCVSQDASHRQSAIRALERFDQAVRRYGPVLHALKAEGTRGYNTRGIELFRRQAGDVLNGVTCFEELNRRYGAHFVIRYGYHRQLVYDPSHAQV